jgi:hypothetical protein
MQMQRFNGERWELFGIARYAYRKASRQSRPRSLRREGLQWGGTGAGSFGS